MSKIYKGVIGSISFVSFASYLYYQKSMYQYNQFMEDWNNNKQKNLYKTQNSLLFDYDDNADRYEKIHKIDFLRKSLLSNVSGFVLETCVGTSRNIIYYPQGCSVIGVDWNQNYLEQALRKPIPNSIQFIYKVEDIEKLTLKSELFDCVVDTFGLNYTLYPEKCLEEIKRVCKPKGKIILLETGQTHYFLQNKLLDFELPKYIYRFGYFNNRDWDAIIKQSGLKIIEKDRKNNGSLYIYILENT